MGGDQARHPNRHKGPLKRLDLTVLHGCGDCWVRIWESVVFEAIGEKKNKKQLLNICLH